jgi:hypothetical protein
VAALFSDQPVLKMPQRLLAAATAVTCWVGLGLQFAIMLQATTALAGAGEIEFPLIAAIIVFVCFLSNHVALLIALVTSAGAAGLARFQSGDRLRAALLAYVWAGSAVFFLVLNPAWQHHGTQYAVELLLHGVAPLLYFVYWFLCVPKTALRWRDPLVWLIYPVVYLVAVLAAARLTKFYPYPFIDLSVLSADRFAANLAAVAATFLAFGFAVVALARATGPNKGRFDRRGRAA